MTLTGSAKVQRVLLSPDGQTVAWQERPSHGDVGVNRIHVYTQAKDRSIECDPFIRDFWFWDDGHSIAIDCGGAHFAGRSILYALPDLKQVDVVEPDVNFESRPDWARGGASDR